MSMTREQLMPYLFIDPSDWPDEVKRAVIQGCADDKPETRFEHCFRTMFSGLSFLVEAARKGRITGPEYDSLISKIIMDGLHWMMTEGATFGMLEFVKHVSELKPEPTFAQVVGHGLASALRNNKNATDRYETFQSDLMLLQDPPKHREKSKWETGNDHVDAPKSKDV